MITPGILLADDDPLSPAAMQTLLQGMEVCVVSATSGEEALVKLEGGDHTFAVVLLDVAMPDIDGFEAALRVRQQTSRLQLPVILLCDDPTPECMLRGYLEGAVDFMAKPVVPAMLRSKIKAFIDLYQAREALLRQEQFAGAICRSAHGILYAYDLKGDQITFAQGVSETLGYARQDAMALHGRTLSALLHPDDLSTYAKAMELVGHISDGETNQHRFRMRHADGTWKWLQHAWNVLSRDSDGSVRQIMGTARDLSVAKTSSEKSQKAAHHQVYAVGNLQPPLAKSERRLQLLMENVVDHAIFTLDLEGRIQEWNNGAEHIFHYLPGEITGQDFSILFTPEDRSNKVPAHELATAAREGKAFDERWHLKKEGERFYASGVTTALRDDQDNLIGFAKICRDLTSAKINQEQLRENEERLKLITDSLPVLIGYIDNNLRYQFNNAAYEQWFGLPRDGINGRLMHEVMGSDAFKVLRPYVERAQRGEHVHFQRHVPYRTGPREISADYVPHIIDGKVRGLVVLVSDDTERKREERRRQFLLDVSETLASSLSLNVVLERVAQMAVPEFADWCVVDSMLEDGSIERLALAHPNAEKRMIAEDLERLYPPVNGDEGGARRVIQTGQAELVPDVTEEMLLQTARDEHHMNLLRKLGIGSYMCVPLQIRGRTIGAITFIASGKSFRYGEKDLNLAEELARRAAPAIDNARLYRSVQEENARRRETEASLANAHEEALRASQAKSAFLSTMSHELRTPLNAVIGYAEFLQELMDERGEAQVSADLEKIKTSASHLLTLINDILDLSKIEAGKVTLNWEETDIKQAVDEAVSMVKPTVERNNNTIVVGCHEAFGKIPCDPTRLRQILFNLLSNAAKFTQHGTITIDCFRRIDDEGKAHLDLKVADTGPGIAPDHLTLLFRSFQQFDTGRKLGGTGLGLAISKLLAQAMGGDLTATSRAGQGATFKVSLPLTRE